MLGKAMRFATVCTLAFAICGKANRGKFASFSKGTTEDRENRSGQETSFEDHLSNTMNVSSILMRKPTIGKLAKIIAVSAALTSADAFASPGAQAAGVRSFHKAFRSHAPGTHNGVRLYSSQPSDRPQPPATQRQRQQEERLDTRSTQPSHRTIASIQKYARLPVWPAWNGALLFLLSIVLPPPTVAKLEDKFGGRVCPNFFPDPVATSPFILLVHHVHSFFQLDPLRSFQKRFVLPEGFPSHPHRGFITLTYCLKGGMVHRDSLGVKQRYGAEKRHGGSFAQWLVAGAGILHEEMWDVEEDAGTWNSEQELFQLWVNLPSSYKMVKPTIRLMGDGEGEEVCRTPTVTSECGRVETIVLVGEYDGTRSCIETASPMSILHVRMKPSSETTSSSSSTAAPCTWTMDVPPSFRTAILYMRTGSAHLLSDSSGTRPRRDEIPTHHTATLSSSGQTLRIEGHETDGADFLLLAGEPIREVVEARGSMVMTTPGEIQDAYRDYEGGLMGRPWDHALTDEEWTDHVERFPSKYR